MSFLGDAKRTSMLRLVLIVLALSLALTLNPNAQDAFPEAWVEGLQAPVHLLRTNAGNLLVAEAGAEPNSGRISLVVGEGQRRTLLDGLPSGIDLENTPSGPSALALRARTLFIAIGQGDATRFGETPGFEVANPNGPSSPILSSVLMIHFNTDLNTLQPGFSLSLDDHFALAEGFDLVLENDVGNRAFVELLTDFRDVIPNPTANVRGSNPFGLALDRQRDDVLYVADAARNTVVRVDINTGRAQTLWAFSSLDNPTSIGPPQLDAVPTSVRAFEGGLLVSLLTGFPNPPGLAKVDRIDPATRSTSAFIQGLTSAIDVLPATVRGEDVVYVLEFSSDLTAQPPEPGRLLRYDAAGASPVVVGGGLITPTSVAVDPDSGELFISELFTGRIVRIRPEN